jgi:muramoyltetrapeptide carboxypeptidase
VVTVVAPSGPFEHALGWVALGWLARRYRVRYQRGLFACEGYLAGSDARRQHELSSALSDATSLAVIAMRGGYGASRFAHRLDWHAFGERPTWVVGFSDATVLHVEAATVQVASIHGPNLSSLGRADERSRRAFLEVLENPHRRRTYPGLRVLRRGAARGPLFGGNLTMLHACAAAGRLRVPEGCVLLLEDVTERPYRIDRMLSALTTGAHLSRAVAVVLGDFTQCDAGPDGTTVEHALARNLLELGIPVVSGLPVGHGDRNDAVVLGGTATLDATGREGELVLGED